jgi:ABC-type glutathione transport system ATPase component
MSQSLSAGEVSVRYPIARRRRRASRTSDLLALDHVNVTVPPASMVGIVGESGAGKSTLAKVLAGVIAPGEGTVRYGQTQLEFPRQQNDARIVQMVPQDPGSSLNPALSVGAVLEELLRFHELTPLEQIEQDCAELMDLVGLSRETLESKPGVLSGGERQRVALARAVALRPAFLLADEILSSLDTSVGAGILNLLTDLHQRLEVAIVLISHDLAVVNAVCEEVIVMHRGAVLERGRTAEIFANPTHPYTRSLLQSARRLSLPSGAGAAR